MSSFVILVASVILRYRVDKQTNTQTPVTTLTPHNCQWRG